MEDFLSTAIQFFQLNAIERIVTAGHELFSFATFQRTLIEFPSPTFTGSPSKDRYTFLTSQKTSSLIRISTTVVIMCFLTLGLGQLGAAFTLQDTGLRRWCLDRVSELTEDQSWELLHFILGGATSATTTRAVTEQH